MQQIDTMNNDMLKGEREKEEKKQIKRNETTNGYPNCYLFSFFFSSRFTMNIKLFCVMGISWLLEILATVYKQDSLWWAISDIFNCLQGVMVFLIFVFKKKVWVAFQKKLGVYVGWKTCGQFARDKKRKKLYVMLFNVNVILNRNLTIGSER